MKRIPKRFFIVLTVLSVLFLSACASDEEKLEKALKLYAQSEYEDAAEILSDIKNSDDARFLREKCEILAKYQNEDSVKKLVNSYISDLSKSLRDHETFKKISYASLNLKEKKELLENPEEFLDFAISYSKKNGDAEIVVAMYPYFKDGFRDTDLAFFEKELDPYIGELETMRDFYKKNPKLAEVCEKYDGIKLRDAATNTINGDGKPVIDDFCTWIKDESNDAVLEAIKPLIDAKEQVVDISNMNWDRESLAEYFGDSAYGASDPKDNAFIVAFDDGSERDQKYYLLNSKMEYEYLKDVSEAVASATDLTPVTDPDQAKVIIYLKLTFKDVNYSSSDGKSLTVHAGTEKLTAYDAVSGVELADITLKPDLDDTEYGSGDEHYYRYPNLSKLGDNSEFTEFIEKIR